MGQLGMTLVTKYQTLNYFLEKFSKTNALSSPREIPFFKDMIIKPYVEGIHFVNMNYLEFNSSIDTIECWIQKSKNMIMFHFE